MPFDFEAVRDVLRCPKSISELALDGDSLVCTNAECRLRFPIRDEFPILLIEEAEELGDAEWNAAISRSAGSD